MTAGALKLVADAFPWQQGSVFAYTRDNHNSVLGMREVAMKEGAAAVAVDLHPGSSQSGLINSCCAR